MTENFETIFSLREGYYERKRYRYPERFESSGLLQLALQRANEKGEFQLKIENMRKYLCGKELCGTVENALSGFQPIKGRIIDLEYLSDNDEERLVLSFQLFNELKRPEIIAGEFKSCHHLRSRFIH